MTSSELYFVGCLDGLFVDKELYYELLLARKYHRKAR